MAATEQGSSSGAHRLVALGAVGFLAAATAIAFGRVFAGHGPTWKLLAAGLASVAVAGLLERRSLLVATLASAALLPVAVGLLVFPDAAWYGLPGPEAVTAIREALERVGEQARVQVAPTAPLPPLMLAAVTAVWTAAFSAHALAARAGSPLLAVLPPVALVGFADTVMEDGARPGYTVILLSAVLFVVFADGLRRIHQWGPLWGARGRSLFSTTGHGARRVAFTAVAVSVLAPGILPGFRSPSLVDFSNPGTGSVRIDPFVSIKAQLERRDPIDLFQVASVDEVGKATPAYWRLYALDQFDGSTWRSSDPEARRGQVVATPARLRASFLPGTATLDQRYRVLTDLGDRWLPMAYPPETIDLPFGVIRYDPELTAALAPDSLAEGLEYSVSSRVVSPTPTELDRVTFEAMPGRYTFVPGNVPRRVRQIAEEWTADAPTAYRKVLSIQTHFTAPGDFEYSLDVTPRSDVNALVDFLTRSKRGFCQQFATAMAILVRALGIPARVAVGFRPGSQAGNVFTVSTEEAHSWVEVLFPGYGWLAFEPTPGGWQNPLATPGSYISPATVGSCPPDLPGCETGGETTVGGVTTGGTLSGKLQNVEGPLRGQVPARRGRDGGFTVPEPGYAVPYGFLLLVLLGVGALLVVAVPIAKAVVRRRMVRRVRDPRELVLAAYRVFDGEAADMGLGRAEGETLAEHRDRLWGTVRFSDGHLDRLTNAAVRAAYSRRAVTPAEARDAVRDARTAIRDIRRDAKPVRRILGVYRPGV